MNHALSLLLCLILVPACSRAGHPVFIDIRTEPTGTRYIVNTQVKTPEEIDAFLRAAILDFTPDGIYRDGIFIRPDAQTSFATVFDLLRRIRAVGVKRCEIIGSEAATHLIVTEHDFPRERAPDAEDYFRPTPPAK